MGIPSKQQIERLLARKPSITRLARDSDGDKLINPLDCQPYNSKKQGWFHDKAKAAYGFVKTKVKTKLKERKEEHAEQKIAERESYRAEGIKVARERGRQKARGTGGSFGKAFSGPSLAKAFTQVGRDIRTSGGILGTPARRVAVKKRKKTRKVKRRKTRRR